MRAIALLATYNEERFVAGCLEHLFENGLEAYLLDNQSTDGTVPIARQYAGNGLLGIETIPRTEVYTWRPLLERKAELGTSLDADWFMHVDADEIRLPPPKFATLLDAFDEADAQGYNAVNFQEFTFVPTREDPDHDHSRFRETMRWYYPFLPRFPDRLNAWKRQPQAIDLADSGGHRVAFPGLRMYPRSFPMLHYLFLSIAHAIEKYVRREYDPAEVQQGWHRARATLRAEDIVLLPASELRRYDGDGRLDPSEPRTRHPLFSRPP